MRSDYKSARTKALFGFKILILNAVGLQIRPNEEESARTKKNIFSVLFHFFQVALCQLHALRCRLLKPIEG